MPEQQEQHRVNADEVAKQVLAALKSQGGGESVSEQLIRENVIARERRREAEEALEELKKKVPAADAVVLTPEQAKDWTAYQALGKPDEVKTKMSTLEGEIAKRDREIVMASAADAAGYKAAVLTKLPGAEKLKFEVREEQVDGKATKVAYVTGSGEGAKTEKLSEYAEREWKDFIPALSADASSEGGTRTKSTASGTPFRAQQGTTRAPEGKGLTDEEVADRKRRSGAYSI